MSNVCAAASDDIRMYLTPTVICELLLGRPGNNLNLRSTKGETQPPTRIRIFGHIRIARRSRSAGSVARRPFLTQEPDACFCGGILTRDDDTAEGALDPFGTYQPSLWHGCQCKLGQGSINHSHNGVHVTPSIQCELGLVPASRLVGVGERQL